MPFPNEHAARLKTPGQFKRFRRENDRGGPGVDFIFGIKDTDEGEVVILQSIRFDKEKFTVKQAKKWLDDHDFDPILFEEASGEEGEAEEGSKSKHLNDNKRKKRKAKSLEIDGRTISTGAIRHLVNPAHEIQGKADDGEHGSVEGFAAIHGKVDLVNEMFAEGAFAKSISDLGGEPVPLMTKHFRDGGDIEDMVGRVVLEDRAKGVHFSGPFLGDARSQRVRDKVLSGSVRASSIGFRMIDWDVMGIDGKTILVHTQSQALETTLTIKPLNPLAVLTGAKDIPQLEDELGRMCALLKITPEEMTEERAQTLLIEHLGGRSEADAFIKGTGNLIEHIEELLAACAPQGTPAGNTDGKAAATNAALHEMRKELEIRKLNVRRLLLEAT